MISVRRWRVLLPLLVVLLAAAGSCRASPVAAPASTHPHASSSSSPLAPSAIPLTQGPSRAITAPSATPSQPPRPAHHAAGVNVGPSPSRPSFTETVAPTQTQRPPSRGANTNTRSGGQSDIVFPDSQYRPRFSGAKPTCARSGSTFCEGGVEGYPMVHLNQLLENAIGYREYFGNDTLGPNLADRIAPDEETICPSEEKIIYPKMGQNANGEWVFIVNLDSNYQQGIRVEQCKKGEQPCLYGNVLPQGVNATCKQKYIYRRLVAVGDGGDAQPDSFKVPSCCACYVNSDVTSRILRPNAQKRRRRHMTRK